MQRSWLDQDRIIYLAAYVKNQRSHIIPMGEQALEPIDRLPDKADLLFPSRFEKTKPFNGSSKCKAFFDKDLEIEPHTLHDLRRTFSSNMAKLGTPIHVTERILNHVSGTISGGAATYNRHTYLEEMRGAFTAHDEFLANLISDCKALNFSGNLSKPGQRDALLSRRDRDEDTFKTSGQRDGLELTTTHRTTGGGRPFPQAGKAGPEPGGLG